jgi:NADH dehydrogenase
MAQEPLRIVVIGAGYAGLVATVRLAGRLKREVQARRVTITLVNAADAFVERLRLHQLAANRPIPDRPIAETLRGTGIAFVRGTVIALDTRRRTLEVQTGSGIQAVAYDNLVYALGSTIDRDNVPGAREFAHVLTPAGPRSAMALRELLPKLNAAGGHGRLLVGGGGATGIEAAAEFAEAYPNLHVRLVTQGEFGQFINPHVAAYMRHSLYRLGVAIQDQTTIVELRAQAALTASGEVLPFDVCLWTGGFTVPRLAREAGLAVNERGQVLVDPFLRSVSHPEIYAVGDAAYPVEPPGAAVRMAAFTAVLMGAHGADSLSAAVQGRTPKPFSFAYLGQAISLGRRDAIGFNNIPDDVPNWPYFTGRAGVEGREFFVRLLADQPNFERRLPGAVVWLGKGRYTAARRKAQALADVQPSRRRLDAAGVPSRRDGI